MNNELPSIFEVPDQNSQDSYEVIEGNVNESIITTDHNSEITAGNINETVDELNQIATDLHTNGETKGQTKALSATLLWQYINEHCYQPFYSAFKGQIVAEALQVSISIVPILIYHGIRKPYTPCQDKPESFFIQLKAKKVKKKTWKQRIFSLETLCILTLATTVFMAGVINDDVARSNDEFKHSKNRKGQIGATNGSGNGFQRKYGAYV
eukprot:911273_1